MLPKRKSKMQKVKKTISKATNQKKKTQETKKTIKLNKPLKVQHNSPITQIQFQIQP